MTPGDEGLSARPWIDIWELGADQPAERRFALSELLSEDERARGARYRSPQLRDRWMTIRGWLRETLSLYAETNAADLGFAYSARGKPSLASDPHIHFNLSHSADRALLAISGTAGIGADIEQIRLMDDQDQVIRRFYHPSEASVLLAMGRAERSDAFFQLWALKESCMKATGLGLGLDPREIVFDVPVRQAPRLLSLRDESCPEAWHFVRLDEFDRFAAALAYRGVTHEIRRRHEHDHAGERHGLAGIRLPSEGRAAPAGLERKSA